jgi:antirestriction protein
MDARALDSERAPFVTNDGQGDAVTTPRIYVACLAAYNNERLHGRWINAHQSPDELYSEVQAMLAASPEPGAEEWAIHDHEGFGPEGLLETELLERVSAIAATLVEHDDALGAY